MLSNSLPFHLSFGLNYSQAITFQFLNIKVWIRHLFHQILFIFKRMISKPSFICPCIEMNIDFLIAFIREASNIYIKLKSFWNYLNFIKRICICHTIEVCFRFYIKWFYSEFIVEFNKYYRWREKFNYDYRDLQRPFIYNIFFFFGFLVQNSYCVQHWIVFKWPLIIFTINYDLFISCVVFVERIVRLQDEFYQCRVIWKAPEYFKLSFWTGTKH